MRFRIASRRGDLSFFVRLEKKLTAAFPAWTVQANALTGSMLAMGETLTIETIKDFGHKEKLFDIEADMPTSRPMALSVAAPLQSANRRIQEVTSGRVDLPGAVCVALLVFGIIEIIRGNWRTPPWYTALWYAFGIYSKSMIDQVTKDAPFASDSD
jgi:hypothetical protein